MIKSARILAALTCLLAAFSLVPLKSAVAFDTGHHSDISRIVLKRIGFNTNAIHSVLLANWLTDYYSNAVATNNLLLRPALTRMHFDNLRTLKEVENYHAQLLKNLKLLAEEAAWNNDLPALLIVLGLAQHVTQDFYAHSNWAELYPRKPNGQFDADLFPRSTAALKGKLRTGTFPSKGNFSHGNYTFGLNKDSHVRPHWENAYVLAYAATRRITIRIRDWVEDINPGIWSRAASLQLPAAEQTLLQREVEFAKNISMWVKASVLGLAASDGHWKGNLSGHSGKFTAANNAFASRKASFLAQAYTGSKIAPRLALNLKDAPAAKTRELLRFDDEEEFEGRAIIVKIHSYRTGHSGPKPLSIGAITTI
ncbi:MAG: hypothetical protein AAF478_14420, partial [Pseudomonadota bacterium]